MSVAHIVWSAQPSKFFFFFFHSCLWAKNNFEYLLLGTGKAEYKHTSLCQTVTVGFDISKTVEVMHRISGSVRK